MNEIYNFTEKIIEEGESVIFKQKYPNIQFFICPYIYKKSCKIFSYNNNRFKWTIKKIK